MHTRQRNNLYLPQAILIL